MAVKRRGKADPVSPELWQYVVDREAGCMVAILAHRGEIVVDSDCRDRYGTPVDGFYVRPGDRDRVLTADHVRDRRGGRLGKRPPSIPRRLAAVCHYHHLLDLTATRKDVREAMDRELERREGQDVDLSRPWEIIRRIRAGSPEEDGHDVGASPT